MEKEPKARTGRPEAELPDNFWKIVRLYDEGRITADDAAYMSGVSRATFYRKRNELRTMSPLKSIREEMAGMNA